MRYLRAQDIFPADILEKIQEYVDGQYIYIPRKEDEKLAWGEKTRSKEETRCRNTTIFDRYRAGTTVEELAAEYYLTEKSIRRILSDEKKRRSRSP